MNELTCVIIGGGHAGLHAFKAIKDKTRGMANGRRIRFVLFDKQPGHVRKVLLFRPAVSGEEIVVPWTRWSSEGIEFVQGAVTSIDSAEKQIRYTDGEGNEARAHYDLLVVAVGSIVRRPDPAQGGIALTDPQAAADIRERWLANLQKAARETSPEERKRLLTGVVAGAGISGIETSAELALAMREEASALGLNPSDISVYLLNAHFDRDGLPGAGDHRSDLRPVPGRVVLGRSGEGRISERRAAACRRNGESRRERRRHRVSLQSGSAGGSHGRAPGGDASLPDGPLARFCGIASRLCGSRASDGFLGKRAEHLGHRRRSVDRSRGGRSVQRHTRESVWPDDS